MKNNRLTVYADLNCPFCYALHERLVASDYIGRVDWRIIEHAPQISFDTKDFQVQSELNAEVSKVEILAPDITINVPSGRPNTHIANQILSEIQQNAPEQVDYFRALLYRALWIDGMDISDPVTIEGLLRKAGVANPNIEQSTRTELQQWQEEWEQGDFSRNIPALLTDDGNKLLGLPSPQLLILFICGDHLNIGTESDAICTLHPRQKIIIATSDADLGQNFPRYCATTKFRFTPITKRLSKWCSHPARRT